MPFNSTAIFTGPLSGADIYLLFSAFLLAGFFIITVVSCCSSIYRQHFATPPPPLPPPTTAAQPPRITIQPLPWPPLRSSSPGLSKNVLNSFPKLRYSVESVDKYTDCAICLSEFRYGDELRILPPCSHGFHVECIDLWLVSHPTCPSCRRSIVPEWCVKIGRDDSGVHSFIT